MKDNFKTEVIFRKVKSGYDKGTIEAFFPYVMNDRQGNILCFSLFGGHGGACWQYLTQNTVPAKEHECNDIKKHLELNYGYNLKIVKRRNYKRYLTELNKVRQ